MSINNEIKIGHSIGKIKLGMKRNEVNALIDNLVYKKVIPYGYAREVAFDYNNEYQIWYDENNLVNFIMCYRPDEMIFNGKLLNVDISYNDLLEFVKQSTNDVEEDDYGFISNKLGFGVTITFEDENIPFIDNVQVTVENFWLNELKINHPK